MGIFFSVIFFLSAVCIILFLAISVYTFFFQKERYKTWLKRVGIAAAVLIVSVIGGVSTTTPEQKEAYQQKVEVERATKEKQDAEKAAQKAQEAAEKKQKEEQEAKEKEKLSADAAAQKVYDDQAKYEKWVRTSAIIGKSPGLGDRVDEFAKKHKISSDVGMIKSFDDDHFNVAIVDGRIENLTINAAAGHKMDSLVSELTPSDGTEVSSTVDNSDPLLSKHISIGRSDMLDMAIPRSNGYYTRIDTYDSRSGDYLHTTLAIGQKE